MSWWDWAVVLAAAALIWGAVAVVLAVVLAGRLLKARLRAADEESETTRRTKGPQRMKRLVTHGAWAVELRQAGGPGSYFLIETTKDGRRFSVGTSPGDDAAAALRTFSETSDVVKCVAELEAKMTS